MKKFTKRFIGLVLVLAMLLSLVPAIGFLDIEAQAATVSHTPMPNYIQDGVTLHCWNWSIANIRANLGLIANSGYSAIQLSPMQELKESTINKPFDNWWVVYQPISFNINTRADHAVGTKSELIELCQEAHKYGLKVIMDVVTNHTANGGSANTLCPQVDPDLLNDPDCWHDYRKNSWDYSDRYNITQYCMAGLPDLNTGNKKVQQKVLNMLKEYIDCGVDGFRWDAAKQIETPSDVYCSSDFWPTVIDGANSYASSTRGIYLYNYGELLENTDSRNSLHIGAYTQFMSVTESVWSNDVRYKLEAHNAGGLQKGYFKETTPDKMVLWAESHDTFGDKSSIYSSQYNLDKAWSLVSSRAYAMALFFPRANDMLYQEMGELAKVSWTSKLTTAVNKFHNHFAGQSEYLTQDSYANLYYNERGNSGIIITNFNDGGRDINIPVYAMAGGTYYDQITGNRFTVSGGRLYGTMGDTGVAVVYNPGTKSCNHTSHGSDGYCYSCYAYVGHKSGTTCSTCGTASTRTIYFNNTAGWSTPYLYGWNDNGGNGTAGWPGVKMTKVEGTIYKATIPTTATNVIFHNNNGTQTANITPSAKADIYHYNTGFWSSSTGADQADVDYYLFGYINGANYGCEGDHQNLGQYKFVNGTLTTTFAEDSYVAVKTSDNLNWYMTAGWMGESTSAVLYNSEINTDPNKLFVPGGVEVTFTLVNNGDDSLTLSYVAAECAHRYSSSVTVAATCLGEGLRTSTCLNCGDSYTETIPATGHSYIDEVIAPTCENNGYTRHTCTACGYFHSTDAVNPTGHTYMGGKCVNCGAADPSATPKDYYLFGFINGANYAYEDDWENLGQYKFVDGKLTASFDQDSYVGVKTSDNAGWYMTNGWQGTDVTSVKLYSSDMNANPDKLYVPGGVQVTFTLKANTDGTLTLSYTTTGGKAPEECSHSYSPRVTAATCTSDGYTTYVCSKCYDYYTEIIPATGHSYVGGQCSTCGEKDLSGEYYLFGWINDADCGIGEDHNNLGAYKFVDGKVTVTFTSDSYVAVKTGDNQSFYMTNGWQGEVSSATLYKFTDPYSVSANKLMVSGGQTVTFTLTENWDGNLILSYTVQADTCNHASHNQNGACTLCGAAVEHSFSNGLCTVCGLIDETFDAFDYYLFGYINGANYGCEEDYANLGEYQFAEGKLTVTFDQDSYVGVKKTYPNGKFGVEVMGWYMTEGWQGTDATSATLVNSNQNVNPDKLYVPGGRTVTFTLEVNDDGTLTLSYEVAACEHLYNAVTSGLSCTTDGTRTYTCGKCGHSYTEAVSALGHNYVGGYCSLCGQSQNSGTQNGDYYLFGYINGADYGIGADHNNLGAYKFVDGKVTVTFTEDSYVAVKTSDNQSFYMTNGWLGAVTSANLHLFTDPYTASANKLMVSGGQTVTFTLTDNGNGTLKLRYTVESGTCSHIRHNQNGQCATCGATVEHTFAHGVCTVCGLMDSGYEAYDYYLFGYINGANYGSEEDWQNLGFFKFRSIGTCSATFTSDSYVGVKKVDPGTGEVVGWYMTNGWQGTDTASATLYNTNTLGGNADKLYAPAGVRLVFTLVNNGDGTLSLSYADVNCNHTFDSGKVTSQAGCGTEGTMTYTCVSCGHYYEETLAAVGHNCVGGECTRCGAADPNSCCTDHSYAIEYQIQSSCTEAGVRSFRAACGATYTVSLPFSGHSYNSRVETAATCVLPGLKSFTCSCGDSYSEPFAALGHQYQDGRCKACGASQSSGEVVDQTYYLFGSINGVDYGCGNDWENLGEYLFVGGQLTATFDTDSYVAVKTGDNANWFMTESYVTSNSATFHSTTTGVYEKMFVPGGVRVTFTLTENADGSLTLSYTTAGAGSSVILPTLNLKYPTMSFKDEVKLNIYYEATDLNNVVDMGLIVFGSQVDSYTVYNAESVVAGYNYNTSAGLYTVSTNGIPAKNMGDTVWFAVYAQLSNGTYAYSKLVSYSPRDYAYALLGSGDAKLDALLVAMLNYGAAAQTYFGYRISNLLNSDLTAAQKGLITGYNSSMVTNITAPSAAKQGAFVKNGGYDDMFPSVTFGGAFAINYYCVPSYTPVSGVTMYYWREAEYNAASVLTPSNATGVVTMTGSGTYRGSVTGISAKDLGDGVYVAFVYSTGSNTYCSGVLQYSIGMYCDTMVSYPNEFTPFAQATAVYGYYAKQYFG